MAWFTRARSDSDPAPAPAPRSPTPAAASADADRTGLDELQRFLAANRKPVVTRAEQPVTAWGATH